MIEGKLSAARGRATCGGTGAQAPKKPEVGGLEGVHLRQPLGDQLLAEVLQALAPNLPQLLIESLVLSGSIIPGPRGERPERARAGFPTRARPDAASLQWLLHPQGGADPPPADWELPEGRDGAELSLVLGD